jgi:hypothetical protein
MTPNVKTLSQQNIRAAGSTAAVSLAQVSFTFPDSVSDFLRDSLKTAILFL